MKVLFLDFDGVLNSQASFEMEHRKRKKDPTIEVPTHEALGAVNVSNVQLILEECEDVRVVISSSWRNLYSLDWIKNLLESYHLDSSKVVDKTPSLYGFARRGEEIEAWLDAHPEVTSYVILDDDSDMTEKTKSRHVKTDSKNGMSYQDYLAAVKMFNNECFVKGS